MHPGSGQPRLGSDGNDADAERCVGDTRRFQEMLQEGHVRMEGARPDCSWGEQTAVVTGMQPMASRHQ